MAESRYNLRRTLHPTPKSKINETALARRKTRKRTASPSPSPTPPLPPQPDFGITTSTSDAVDMDTGEGSSGQFDDTPPSDVGYETTEQIPDADDHGVDPTLAEVDYWLGAGASQDIASMCVDADLSLDEDASPSSVEGNVRASVVPSSADEELENKFTQDGRASPDVKTVDTAMAPPLPDNPFPTLNPFPQFIFPDPMVPNDTVPTDATKEAVPRAHEFALPQGFFDDLPTHGPSSALPDHTAKEAYLKALGFGPSGNDLPVHGPSSALRDRTAKEAHLKALGFGRPGALPGGFDAEADPTRQKTGLSTAEVDYNAPAEDEDSFLFPNSDNSPLADDAMKDVDESREPAPRQQAGRISSPTWDVLNTGFQKIDDIIDRLADKTGHTHDNIIALWKRTHAHECTGSMWNKYQKYFLAHREKERRRIGDSRANCKYSFCINMFSTDSDDLGRTCWLGFKEHEPRWREILEAYDEVLAASNVHSTISQRTRKFDALVSQLKRVTNKAAEQDGFESLFVLVGNSIHEDVGLSQIHLSAGAEEVCPSPGLSTHPLTAILSVLAGATSHGS